MTTQQLVTIFSILMPGVVLTALLLFTNKIPHANRRILFISLAVMLVIDIFLIYRFVLPLSKVSTQKEQPQNPATIAALAKFPVEAQNFAFTRSCQSMQKELLKDRGFSEDQLNTSSLPVCTCITAQLMAKIEFKEIEQMSVEGKTFFSVLDTHKSLVTDAMNACSGG